MKLTPEEVKRIYALAEKLDISFVDVVRIVLEIGLKSMEEINADKIPEM